VRTVQRAPVTGVVLLVALLAVFQATVGLGVVGWTVGLVASATAAALLAVALHRARTTRFGPANGVTLARATLGQAVAALVAASFAGVDHRGLLLGLTVLALALDAVDGRLARRTHSVTRLGARFDMETDAFLILVLSLHVSRSLGPWVLAIGLMRYASVAAGWVLPWLRGAVPPRYWRKVVAATQGIVLTCVASTLFPHWLEITAVAGALALLCESFGRDVVWLWRSPVRGTRVSAPAGEPATGPPPS